MILAQCGSCENQLKFPDDWIGKLIQCPNCGSMVELPAIAVAKPIRNSEKRIDVRPREITTESLIDIDVSNEQQTPKKNHGDCENDANQNDANHNDEIERTDTSDEYSVVSPTVANSQSPQPYENGFTPLNQPTADPYTGTPINVTPVPGTSYPAPSGIEAPLGALPTFNQYQANKSVQAQPVQAQPVQAQPVQAQPVQAQPVQAQPVQAQPVQAQPVQAQPVQAQPVQAQSVQAQSVQAQPVQAQPVQAQPVQAQSVQAQPVQAQPVQAQSVQAQSVQAQPVQAQPVQAQPVQAQPVQAQPVQAQPVQAQPVQAQPVPTKPVETAPIDVARSDAQKTSKPPLIKSGVAQKKSIEEHENRQADENPASQKEAVSTSSDTKHPPVSNKPHQSDSLTTTKDDKEEDSLTLLRDSPKSKLHDSGLLDGDQADDTLLLEKRPADDPATATPNTNTSRSQASEKPEKNFTKEAAEQKPNEPVLAAKRIQPQKEKPAENQGAAVPLDSIVKAPPNSKKEFAGQPVQPQPVQPQPVQPQPVQPQPVQTQPVQATATPVQNDAGNDALPAIAKAVPIATASPPVIPAQEIAATTPVPSPHPTSPQPTNAKRSQLDKKPKFGEKKTIKLSPGAKKAVLYGSIGTALVVAVLLSLVFIQKMITSGPVRTFEAYKIAVKNNDFAALYDVVDSATRDTFDNYAEAKSKETPVDYSLRGKDKFVAVATKRFESTDAIKQKTIDSKLQLIEKATIVSESVNRNRASVQVRFEENATESITFEKVDGDWKIGVPTFSLLFIEY